MCLRGAQSRSRGSLLGKRDFHVLEAEGRRVYGYGSDFATRSSGFLVSDDGGRSWEQREVPEPLVALALDPADADRLIASGRMLGFEIPYNADEIDAACREVLAANGLTDGYVRPIAWRGAEQLSVSAQQTRIHLAVAAWSWPNLFGADRMAGVRLGMAPWKRPSPETAPTAASTGMPEPGR